MPLIRQKVIGRQIRQLQLCPLQYYCIQRKSSTVVMKCKTTSCRKLRCGVYTLKRAYLHFTTQAPFTLSKPDFTLISLLHSIRFRTNMINPGAPSKAWRLVLGASSLSAPKCFFQRFTLFYASTEMFLRFLPTFISKSKQQLSDGGVSLNSTASSVKPFRGGVCGSTYFETLHEVLVWIRAQVVFRLR